MPSSTGPMLRTAAGEEDGEAGQGPQGLVEVAAAVHVVLLLAQLDPPALLQAPRLLILVMAVRGHPQMRRHRPAVPAIRIDGPRRACK